MNEAITLVDVRKSYGRDEVLKGIDFMVEHGNFISIRGKSGVGKSTLLRLIGLLDTPTKGTILLFGKDTVGLSDEETSRIRLQEIGFVFQFFNLIPSLKVVENIELPMAIDGVKQGMRRKRGLELLHEFGLEHLAHRYPNEISGGEQQRIAVLRALSNNPRIILADEPTANLDEENSQLLTNLFTRINHDYKVTILLATTNIEEKLPTHEDYILSRGMLSPLTTP